MYYDILDKHRKKILPLLKHFKNDFYLAGGTGLALQIGHRDSIDFDFFSNNGFDTSQLFSKIKTIFNEFQILKIQEEKNTLTILIDNKIKISFFSYDYKLLRSTISEIDLCIASIGDIACMKLSAIISRATNKDYFDLYFILQKISLKTLLQMCKEKFIDIDTNLILKSLVYFDDINTEPIKFKNNKDLEFGIVQQFLIQEVKKISPIS